MTRRILLVAMALTVIAAYEYAFPPQPYSGNCDFPLPDKSPSVFRIAFGSCNDQDEPQPLWETILKSHPDLWLWLGDNIYADTRNMDQLQSMYDKQQQQPGYAKLRASIPVIGTWDDHDYGENGADATWPFKRESQRLFLDFLGEPDSSSRQRQDGVFAAYHYTVGKFRLRVVLLDTRYHRAGNEMLGDVQWNWLDGILSVGSADATIIASSTQILRVDFWKDKWSESGKKRLFSILARHQVPGVVLISGDRHHGEMSMTWPPEMAHPVVELTSSGLTHYKSPLWYWSGQEKNRFRLGAPYGNLNFGIIDVDFSGRRIDLYIVDRHGHARIHHHLPLGVMP